MARPKKQRPSESQLQGFKYFAQLDQLLVKLHAVRDCPQRELHFDRYFALLLFYFFNPALDSLRALQQVTGIEKVRRKLGLSSSVSLSSLSDAGRLFPAEHLVEIIQQLASEVQTTTTDPKLKDLTRTLTAVDGTLLHAAPRVIWALWVDEKHKAAKVHLQLEVLSHCPVRATVTCGNAGEARQLQDQLESGRLYVMDRGYLSFDLFKAILAADSSFVCRLVDKVQFKLQQECELSELDRAADVISDQRGFVGHERTDGVWHNERPLLRLVVVKVLDRKGETRTLRLLTDMLELPAEVIALIYRYRWQIELFFRWFKCILGCRRMILESPNGLQLQVYAALVATILILLCTGCKPCKRVWEMLQFYLHGIATIEELLATVAKQQQLQVKKKKTPPTQS